MQTLTLIKPDDWHIHLRDGDVLPQTVGDVAQRFARGLVMPNLKPPLLTVSEVSKYRERILAAIPNGLHFEPIMTLYLNESMPQNIVSEAKQSSFIKAFKLYPAGATTHSEAGISDIQRIYPLLEKMEEQGLLLLIHGEVTDPTVDIFDREKRFIDNELYSLIKHFPQLKIVLEHITTDDAVEFIQAGGGFIAATITAHHLLMNRNDLLAGGLSPHHYCLPVLKRKSHQDALIQAAISGHPHFFFGSDSAPHAQAKKESHCGCAGIYTAHAAIELLAEIFENAGALDKLEAFTSRFGADFYGLPHNQSTLTLVKHPWKVPNSLPFGQDRLIPLRAGEYVNWAIQ
jgi:dihydroorotase